MGKSWKTPFKVATAQKKGALFTFSVNDRPIMEAIDLYGEDA